MNLEYALTAAALAALVGLPLFRRRRKEAEGPSKPQAEEEEDEAAEAPEVEAKKPAPGGEASVLKAFVLNRKAELVGELAAEGEVVDVGYEDVLRLLEGKGLMKVTRLESPPYTIHILQEGDYFMVAFTRSPDDDAVREAARRLFLDTLRDLA